MKESHGLYASAVLLLLGALPLPYAYYPLLRLATAAAFAFVCYLAIRSRHLPTILASVTLVVLFNPFVPVRMSKEGWAIADVAAAAYAAAIAKHTDAGFSGLGPLRPSVSSVLMAVAAAAFVGLFAATTLAFLFFLLSYPMSWLGQSSPFHSLRYLFPAVSVGAAVFLLVGLSYHVASTHRASET